MEKIKAFIAAVRFALRGERYQIMIQFNDPLLPSGVMTRVGKDGSINVDEMQKMAHAATWNRLHRAGLTKAEEGEGFYVKWAETNKKAR